MKVIIEDVVKRMGGGTEKELPEGTTIRFEIGNTKLTCESSEFGLRIYKVNDTIEGGVINIRPEGSNVIIIS